MIGKTAKELLSVPFVKKEEILGPWLTKGSLVLLYGTRGSGKSNIALSIAHAACTQSPLFKPHWHPARSHSCVYFDSEMGDDAWKQKILEVDSAAKYSLKGEDLRIVSSDDFINISDTEVQSKIRERISNYEIAIFDNLLGFSGRCYPGDTEITIWRRIETFFVSLRNLGKTIILIHHAGKSGDQLGTIEHEKAMDTVIQLKRIEDPSINGMSCEFHFTKNRWFFGKETEALRLDYIREDSNHQRWECRTLSEERRKFANSKMKEGWTKRDLACVLKITDSELKGLLNGSELEWGSGVVPPNGEYIL